MPHHLDPRPARLERARLWLLDHTPAGVLYQPAEWALAVLVTFSGVLTLTGLRTSASLSQALPGPVYVAWGVFMVLGGVALAAGLASTERVGNNYAVLRVPAYRLGLRLIGMTEFVYAFCLLWVAGTPALQAMVGPLVVSALCGVRLLTIAGRR